MAKYVRAKKYLRLLVPMLIIIGAVFVPKVDHSSKTLGAAADKPSASDLQVSQSGQQMYSNMAAANLQPAAVPESSATSSKLSPQQAVPNYCAAGETPYIDGCVSR